MQVLGYKKKSKSELLDAVDQCVSISQLCALIQHEGIVIRMQCFSHASNIPSQKLSTNDLTRSPLDNLKDKVKRQIQQSR